LYDASSLSYENNISKHIKTKLQFTQVSDFSFASVKLNSIMYIYVYIYV
jgi:hypothetical protein